MTFSVETLNLLIGLGTVVLQLGTLFLFFVFLFEKKFPVLDEVGETVRAWAFPVGAILTLGSTLMSLYYSEVLGFAPCGLCWLQRVFFFPQVVLFFIAWKKRDRNIALYSIVLSVFGAVVALYQHLLQMGMTSKLPCPAVSINADCAEITFLQFGYITFPLVSFTLFVFLILLMLFVKEKKTTQ